MQCAKDLVMLKMIHAAPRVLFLFCFFKKGGNKTHLCYIMRTIHKVTLMGFPLSCAGVLRMREVLFFVVLQETGSKD